MRQMKRRHIHFSALTHESVPWIAAHEIYDCYVHNIACARMIRCEQMVKGEIQEERRVATYRSSRCAEATRNRARAGDGARQHFDRYD
jgi:hypothetical protein